MRKTYSYLRVCGFNELLDVDRSSWWGYVGSLFGGGGYCHGGLASRHTALIEFNLPVLIEVRGFLDSIFDTAPALDVNLLADSTCDGLIYR